MIDFTNKYIITENDTESEKLLKKAIFRDSLYRKVKRRWSHADYFISLVTLISR